MAGQYGLLVVINGYNGEQNDSNVTVDFYVSNGLQRDADGGLPTPNFDGNDHWTIDPSSVSGAGLTPRAYSDDTAYVTNGSVVSVGMPKAIPIAFGDRSFLGGATMLLSGAVIVGQIVPYSVSGDGGSVLRLRAERWHHRGPVGDDRPPLDARHDPGPGRRLRLRQRLLHVQRHQERRLRERGHFADALERQQRPATRALRRHLGGAPVHGGPRQARHGPGRSPGARRLRERRRPFQRICCRTSARA